MTALGRSAVQSLFGDDLDSVVTPEMELSIFLLVDWGCETRRYCNAYASENNARHMSGFGCDYAIPRLFITFMSFIPLLASLFIIRPLLYLRTSTLADVIDNSTRTMLKDDVWAAGRERERESLTQIITSLRSPFATTRTSLLYPPTLIPHISTREHCTSAVIPHRLALIPISLSARIRGILGHASSTSTTGAIANNTHNGRRYCQRRL
jgi:hypothetical protein